MVHSSLRCRSAATALAAGGLLCALLAHSACERQAPDRGARMDRALQRAAGFLISRQSADGAWRSQTYGTMADGISLTPAVLKTVMLASSGAASQSACERAAAYLHGFVGADGSISGAAVLEYPVYSASLASIVLNRRLVDGSNDPADGRARDAWLEYLRGFQLNQRLGWDDQDAAFGGWGYGVRAPHRPPPGAGELPFEADLSSTVFAVGALRLCGAEPDDPAIRDALVFVQRCQNFAADGPGDPDYDDGGFFFTPTDRAQNKAGVAGTDRHGNLRYHSYGSATADGVRALVRCGLPADHSRVQAAQAWLQTHFSAQANPGEFEPALAPDRAAAKYYWSWSLAHAFRLLGVTSAGPDGARVAWAPALAEELLARQRPDGSWANDHSFMREDDPLIATTLAAAALATCRDVMAEAPGHERTEGRTGG